MFFFEESYRRRTLLSYVLLWWLSWVIGLTLTVFLVAYGLYLLYLNQKVLEPCTPLEVEWRRLKRYRFERMKNVERVKISAREIDELRIMKEAFEAVLGKDRSFWLWYMQTDLASGVDPRRRDDVDPDIRDMVGVDRSLEQLAAALSAHNVELGDREQRLAGRVYRAATQLVSARRSSYDRSACHSARHHIKTGDAIVLTKNEPIEICFDGITDGYPADSNDNGTSPSVPAPVRKRS